MQQKTLVQTRIMLDKCLFCKHAELTQWTDLEGPKLVQANPNNPIGSKSTVQTNQNNLLSGLTEFGSFRLLSSSRLIQGRNIAHAKKYATMIGMNARPT